MDMIRFLFEAMQPGIPFVITLVGVAITLLVVREVFERRNAVRSGAHVPQQLIMITLTFLGVILLVEVAPMGDSQRGQLLSLIGILLSAAIALSSTTFVGNAMAGVMLRIVRSYQMGDFVRVGEFFGRVSERGLFHTEIQTEDRDLITLPNLYLATNPVKVIRSSGTIISATLSLGYDVHHCQIESVLLEAATGAGFVSPFVHVVELGDFSVSYRVAGMLENVKGLLSARSRLREAALDGLHTAGIEIVSPTFMNTRPIPDGQRFLPPKDQAARSGVKVRKTPVEAQVFDKAEAAASIEEMRVQHEDMGKQLEELEAARKAAGSDREKERIERQIEQVKRTRERLATALENIPEEEE